MAASDNVNWGQFNPEAHKAEMASLESAHGFEINPMGIMTNEGRPFPLVNAELYGEGNLLHTQLVGQIPHEDPEREDKIRFHNVPQSRGYSENTPGVLGTVSTVETHGYPETGSITDSEPRGRFTRVQRFKTHPDLASAIDHLNSAGEERRGHLEAGTTPDTGDGTTYAREVSGGLPTATEGHRPPSTIAYYQYGDTGGPRHGRTIDAGTRDIIPDKDQ